MGVLSAGQFYGSTTARAESPRVTVSRLEHVCGRQLPMHVHEQPYFSMVLGGHYREETGRRAIDYDVMTIVYHPPGTAHVDEIGLEGARFLMIETDQRLVEGHPAASRLVDGYPARLSREAGWTALELLRDATDPFATEAVTLDLLSSVEGRGDAHETRPGAAWIRRVLDRVHDEFADPPTTAELAREAGVHPVHLARAVRAETGATLAALVRQRRIERAIALLQTSESLASIALAVGFTDQCHLTRDFRRVTGFTPAHLRRALTT